MAAGIGMVLQSRGDARRYSDPCGTCDAGTRTGTTSGRRSGRIAHVPAPPRPTSSSTSDGDAVAPIADADAALLVRLRRGDAEAFAALVDRYATSMLHVARFHVPTRAVAEEIVQDTWLAVLQGLAGFEGRSCLKVWVFTILTNRAKTRGERERRIVPFATLAAEEAGGDFTAVDADRFLPADHARWPHHWATPPARWEESPELSLQSAETIALVRQAIDALPPMQRLVITMRDLEEWDSAEICNALSISRSNERVLLHRARSRVRAALEAHMTP
jgi:RNA polymerase sigma-70 factor (ECF subfamily)